MSDSARDRAIEGPQPVMENPSTSPEYYDEDNQPHGNGVGWGLSWGCQLTIGYDATKPDQLHVTVSTSDEDQRRGTTVRSTTTEQVRDYAYQLLALTGVPAPDDDGTGPQEVWIPPSTDCMNYAHGPCPHCGSAVFHHRTGRCGTCGRRPAGQAPDVADAGSALVFIGDQFDGGRAVLCGKKVHPARICAWSLDDNGNCPEHGTRALSSTDTTPGGDHLL